MLHEGIYQIHEPEHERTFAQLLRALVRPTDMNSTSML